MKVLWVCVCVCGEDCNASSLAFQSSATHSKSLRSQPASVFSPALCSAGWIRLFNGLTWISYVARPPDPQAKVSHQDVQTLAWHSYATLVTDSQEEFSSWCCLLTVNDFLVEQYHPKSSRHRFPGCQINWAWTKISEQLSSFSALKESAATSIAGRRGSWSQSSDIFGHIQKLHDIAWNCNLSPGPNGQSHKRSWCHQNTLTCFLEDCCLKQNLPQLLQDSAHPSARDRERSEQQMERHGAWET